MLCEHDVFSMGNSVVRIQQSPSSLSQGMFMITYDDSLAKALHTLPMVLAIGLPLLRSFASITTGCSELARSALLSTCSLLLTICLPALLGGIRSALSGQIPQEVLCVF